MHPLIFLFLDHIYAFLFSSQILQWGARRPQSGGGLTHLRLREHPGGGEPRPAGGHHQRPRRDADAGAAGARAHPGARPPGHLLLHPVPRRRLRRHGPLRALHHPLDVRARHAAEDAGAAQPHDAELVAQLCRTLQVSFLLYRRLMLGYPRE